MKNQVQLQDDIRRYQVRMEGIYYHVPTIGWDYFLHSDFFKKESVSATFKAKMQQAFNGEKPEEAAEKSAKELRGKVVSREVIFEVIPPRPQDAQRTPEEMDVRRCWWTYQNQGKSVPDWLADKLAAFPAHPEDRETKVATERTTFENGEVREKILAVENPRGVYIHKYRDDLYKIVTSPMPMGFPVDWKGDSLAGKRVRDDVRPPEERFQSNLSRARISVEEYGLCNDWDFFVTLTLDPEKRDRENIGEFHKQLVQMILNIRKREKVDIAFLFVPEPHPKKLENEGKAYWHIHGLMKVSSPERLFEPFEMKKKYGKNKKSLPPLYIRRKLKQGIKVYNWKQYERSFGYCVMEEITDRDKSTRYLLKYMRKEAGLTVKNLESGAHMYYHSRGLKRSEKVASECLGDIQKRAQSKFEKHYENCVVSWYSM